MKVVINNQQLKWLQHSRGRWTKVNETAGGSEIFLGKKIA